MKIGVDLDDVLIDFNQSILSFHNEKFGTNCRRDEALNFDLETLWNCTRIEMMERMNRFYHVHDPRSIPAVEGATNILNQLKSEHELIVITGRPFSVEEKTRATIAHHYPNVFREIHFTNFFAERAAAKTKAQFCRELGVQLFIEDHHKWAHQIAEAGVDTLLFDTPWNQAPLTHEKVKRIRHWNEVGAFIQNKK